MKIIRVLQVGMSPYYGGTEAFIMSQYRALDRDKIQFDFLNVYNEKIACQDEIENLGGHIYYLDMSRHDGIFKYYARINNFFKTESANFDIVHCNYQSLINIDILRYAKKYGVVVRIAHAHNSGYGTSPSLLQKLIIFSNRLLLGRYATSFFACSSMAGLWMFHNRKSVIIPNAIDTKKFAYNIEVRNRIRTQMSLSDQLVITFVGRLDPQKNPFFLIDIFKSINKLNPNSKLLIVGDGYLRKDLEEKVEVFNLQDDVLFLGTKKNVDEILQASDIFLLPSKFEGLGIVLVEAQTAGLPCYTSDSVVPPEVNITGLVHFLSLNNKPEDWSKFILDTCDNPNRKDMQRLVSESGYDSIINASKLQSIYFEIASLK